MPDKREAGYANLTDGSRVPIENICPVDPHNCSFSAPDSDAGDLATNVHMVEVHHELPSNFYSTYRVIPHG